MKKNSIWFLGGLSGGHMYPLFSLLKKEIESHQNNQEYYFYIPQNELIEKILRYQKNIEFFTYIVKYPKPERSLKIIIFFFYSILIFFNVFYQCIFDKPIKMYSTGGYFSIPFTLCAWIFSIPFYIYHLDVAPGLAGRLIGICSNVLQCIVYEEAENYLYKKNNIILVDYPIRYTLNDKKDLKASKFFLGKSEYFILFILGGSQGSQEINNYIISIIDIIKEKKIYVIHQTGEQQKDIMIELYKQNTVDALVFDYSDNLVDYYNASDLIISRAGAGTLSEINFFNKYALVIPLQGVALDHQVKNIQYYERKNNLIKVILTKEFFFEEINKHIFSKNVSI